MTGIGLNHSVNYRTNPIVAFLSISALQKGSKYYIKSILSPSDKVAHVFCFNSPVSSFKSLPHTPALRCWQFCHSLHPCFYLAWQYIPVYNKLKINNSMEQKMKEINEEVARLKSLIKWQNELQPIGVPMWNALMEKLSNILELSTQTK